MSQQDVKKSEHAAISEIQKRFSCACGDSIKVYFPILSKKNYYLDRSCKEGVDRVFLSDLSDLSPNMDLDFAFVMHFPQL